MMFEHLTIISNMLFSFILALGLFSIMYIILWVSGLGLHIEKLSTYECGFYPFEDTSQMFSISYYLIAILFIMFDLEIMLIIPLISYYPDMFYLIIDTYNSEIIYQEFFVMVIFLVMITLGFSYEWMKSALYWE